MYAPIWTLQILANTIATINLEIIESFLEEFFLLLPIYLLLPPLSITTSKNQLFMIFFILEKVIKQFYLYYH